MFEFVIGLPTRLMAREFMTNDIQAKDVPVALAQPVEAVAAAPDKEAQRQLLIARTTAHVAAGGATDKARHPRTRRTTR